MYAFIDAHRAEYRVEPICAVLQIAPSGYYRHHQQQRDATCRSPRAQRDATLQQVLMAPEYSTLLASENATGLPG